MGGEKRIKEVQHSCLSLPGTLLKVNTFLMFKNLRGTVFDSRSIYIRFNFMVDIASFLFRNRELSGIYCVDLISVHLQKRG